MIRSLAQSRLLRLFSTSVLDQSMLSASSLMLGVLLLRYAPSEQYGYFVIVQASIMLLVAAQGAWVGGPLAILAPQRTDEQRRQMIGAIEASQRRAVRWLAAGALLVPAAGYLLGFWAEAPAIVATVAVTAAWATLRREMLRRVLLIYAQPNTVFAVDALYVAVLLLLTAATFVLPGPAAAWVVAAVAAGSLAGTVYGRRRFGRQHGWPESPAKPYWQQMRPLGIWTTAGAVIYWVHNQSYNYVLAVQTDLEAVAHANAARLMLMPTVLMLVGVSSLLMPLAAGWLHREGLPVVLRRLWSFALGLLVLNGAYVLLLWVFRDWVTGTLIRTTIPDRDALILLWAASAGVGTIRDMLQCGVLALGRLKPMATITGLSSVVSLMIMWFGIQRYGVPGAVLGILVGESLSLAGVIWLLRRSARHHRAGVQAAAAATATEAATEAATEKKAG